ncbi:ABC-type transport system permease protein (probable substrate copper) (plasmid) [Haloferax gibbonsii]|uniref:ABC-type transport system permease protein (Probable substrate copper) n=1 Tax=Haloferax gibbonsii TaxID=35746 RepID=A0A871BKW7_HALGI|nr:MULTISPECIES: ABC transporter permease subunit [Haloferax]QOS13446.1 ABC-type transport system permease protein (probable substrate copper) [Haloferax gibbonsii]
MSEDQTAHSSTEPGGGTVTAADRSFETSSQTVVAFAGQTLTIAQLEYRLSLRSRWTLALTALFGLLSLLVVGFGGSSAGPFRVDAVVVSLASLATYLVPLAALVYGYDTIVGAEETGWLDMVFALPVSRGRVVVGAFLGRATSLAGATAIGFGLGGLVLFVRVDTVPWGLYADVLFGAVTLGLAFLALGVLVSTVAAEKTHALGIALLVWAWLVFGHDLAALGLVAAFDLPNVMLTGLVLANPIDIFRVFVLSGIEMTGSGMAAVVTGTALSTTVLLGGAMAWVVLPVSVAAQLIHRRSL